ncbi:hypothetical protein BDQ12DRAFT_675421 [Crucibulum laeve]|uniref:Uncharacterized protein n=1 Tax=Crucibulum laeve TaxID=68775 RepID=A0A5C3MGA7_9AGAR|nr:hypothetical protein BDQ12DRAFT_675421 [Crucibulum laeve]
MKIDWASSFRPDGSRRKPPASTMHGWLAKMRGTLLGNESLRSRGMREMREARAMRKYNAAKKKQHQARSGGSIFSFLRPSKKSKPARTLSRGVRGGGQANRSRQHPPNSRRPPMTHKQSSGAASRGSSRGTRPQRPALRPHQSSARRSGR